MHAQKGLVSYAQSAMNGRDDKCTSPACCGGEVAEPAARKGTCEDATF